MLSNRPDHRSKRHAHRLKHAGQLAFDRAVRLQTYRRDLINAGLGEPRGLIDRMEEGVKQLMARHVRLTARSQNRWRFARRRMNLYWLEGRGKIRQGAR